MEIILYEDADGNTAVCTPTAEILELFSIEDVAKKDVPSGVPFRIISHDTVPGGLSGVHKRKFPPAFFSSGVGDSTSEFSAAALARAQQRMNEKSVKK